MFNFWKNILIIFIIQFLTTTVYANGWGLSSEQDALKNHMIVDVGNISEVNPPYGTTWDVYIYKINNRCLGISSYLKPRLYNSKAAMLLVDNSEKLKLAILENSITIEVKLYPVSVYRCSYGKTPADELESAIEHPQSSQEQFNVQLEALKKQQEIYKQTHEILNKLKGQ